MFQQEQEVMLSALRAAGAEVLSMYRDFNDESVVTKKDDDSPLTGADLRSQEILLSHLSVFEYGVLSEELVTNRHHSIRAEHVWVIDPLDGTMDFIQKTGEFSIMVGLLHNNRPVMGGVYVPVRDVLYWAVKGQGAFKVEKDVEKQISVSDRQDSDVRMVVSRNHLGVYEGEVAESLGVVEQIAMGSAGIKFGMLAEGSAELYINSSSKTGEWDVVPGSVILSEAGGVVTDLHGEALLFNKDDPYNRDGFWGSSYLITQHASMRLIR